MNQSQGFTASIALITGASSGFGKVTSELLSENGFRVFGTSRNPNRLKDAPRDVEMLELDVTSNASVDSCVSTLLQRTSGRLDVLINNAGVISLGAVEEMLQEDTLKQLETNLFGVMRVIKAVLPTMRAQRSGRIVNVGSLAGYIPVPFQGMYATAKFALEGYTEQLRHETKNLGISVSIVEPGFFKTNIVNSALFASQEIPDYKSEKARSLSALRKFGEKGGDPIIVAREVLKILREQKPKLHYPVGKEKSGLLFKRLLPQSMFEGQIRRVFRLDATN
jgi:NAD(P)-dependent dehydrogenase (short-subunit alcohol dehydrogenase family)